jgi:quercetin dioxygenase-like cupin family protein
MKVKHLDDMTKGWFVGNFNPSLYKTNDCEVAVKSYKKGDKEGKHYHKIATEITVVIKGKVRMFDDVYSEGDIVVVEPGDATSFEALEDAVNVVVKIPGANNDKYEVEE